MLSDPRVRMLLFSTIRNLLSVFGLVYIVALFSTLHTFYFIFFALGFIGLIYLCYRVQIAFREVFGGGAPEMQQQTQFWNSQQLRDLLRERMEMFRRTGKVQSQTQTEDSTHTRLTSEQVAKGHTSAG